jgi:tetratricopeptide (TPR) repeat protein
MMPAGRPLLVSALTAVFLTAGCEREVHPPLPPTPDLEALGLPVQAQYRELRSDLEEIESRPDATRLQREEAFGALGQWYHVYRLHDGATAAYSAAQSLAPENPLWPYYLAHVARATGDEESSRRHLQRVLKLDPGNLAATVWLAETEWEEGRTEAAAVAFDSALKRDPRCVRALAGRAKAELAQGNAAAAVEAYKRALDLQPGSASLRYSLGLAYRQLGDSEQAARELARVPSHNRDHVPLALDDPWMAELARMNQGYRSAQQLGHRALAAGRSEEAAIHFRRATRADPSAVEARINLAIALDGAGRTEQAEQEAATAVAQHPGFARARVVLGTLLLKQQEFDRAQQQLQAAVDADPDHETARFNLAQLLRRQGDLGAALTHYARVRELDSRLAAACFGHAVTLLWLGQEGAALDALEQDLQQIPADHDLTMLLARVLAAAPDASIRNGPRALDLIDELAGAETTLIGAETLAMAYAEVGRFDDAAAWQEAAVKAARNAGRDRALPRLQSRLDQYSRRQPCREPWKRDEARDSLPVAPPPQ